MAFTRAAEVANLIKRHVLPGVAISLGEAQGVTGIQIVIKGHTHPEDGMSRVWYIHLLGQSGMMLDLTIKGLRKAGFEMSGSAPLMRGRLVQLLSRAEVAKMRQADRELERQKNEHLVNAEIQATASVAHAANSELEVLRSELDRLKEMIEDMALMPTPRGPRGPAGRDGRDGADAAANLESAALGDIGDVSSEEPLERMVLTWKDGKWRPWRAPFRSISQIHAAGGATAGGEGPAGPQGEPGLSAYQLAVAGGFVGSEAEWLVSLRGDAGPSAYEVAVNAGFVGTEQEWLDSLQGENGRTAYELAVEGGFEGTQEEWIESLRGDDGLSAYEIAVNGGFEGTEEEWLESLVGEGGGNGSLTVQQRSRDDLSAAPTGVVTNVSTLSFDVESGFEVQDLGNGSLEAFIKMNSTFNPWLVDGQSDLRASGEEPIEFVAGPGITLTTATNPKQIKWEVTGGSSGGIPEAPIDGNAYVRRNGQWMRLSHAIQELVDGSNVTTGETDAFESKQIDGGNFNDGSTEAGLPLNVGDFDGEFFD